MGTVRTKSNKTSPAATPIAAAGEEIFEDKIHRQFHWEVQTRCLGLTDKQARIAHCIANFAPNAEMGVRYIADRIGCSRSAVAKNLPTLEAAGVFQIKRGSGKATNKYIFDYYYNGELEQTIEQPPEKEEEADELSDGEQRELSLEMSKKLSKRFGNAKSRV